MHADVWLYRHECIWIKYLTMHVDTDKKKRQSGMCLDLYSFNNKTI